MKKLLTGALIVGTALALGGCKQKTNPDSEEVAKTRDTDQRLGAANDRYDDSNKDSTLAAPTPTTPPPATGSADLNGTDRLSGNAQAMNPPNRGTPQADTALNTQGDKSSPEIARNGPQPSALAPTSDAVPPDNTLKGANNPTGPSPVNDQAKGMEMSRSTAFGQQGTDTTVAANDKMKGRLNRAKDDLDQAKDDLDKAANRDLKPSDSDDPQAQREAAYGTAAERLAKLDSRVSEIRARVDNMHSNAAFTETLTDLRRLHESAQGALDQIRDHNVKLNDARDAADRQMTQFEAAINSVQKRIEKAASQT
ncbi:MAG: hypothetical protein QM723_16400 [Myxococcaceae bacterium]